FFYASSVIWMILTALVCFCSRQQLGLLIFFVRCLE
uniref:Uncharacterized protein n=1 Tax=Triticum urartu TaxID=4572 RepID=A0A8R7PM22_TRIUA